MSKSDPSGLPPLALIAGPTASGKSARALALAERADGVVINADASQVYRDLRILSARPTPAEEARAPHRLFGIRDAAQPWSAAQWAKAAAAEIDAAHAAGRLPILVGGTGLYLMTLLDGIAPVPPIDPAVRAAVRALAQPEARVALEREDPAAATALHANDAGRTTRALEVIRATGRSILAWRAERRGGIGGRVALTTELTDLPIDQLYARCDIRFEAMMTAGALDEAAALLARGLDPALPAMRAIGVPPLIVHLRGEIDRTTAVATAQRDTRRYAKRQRTWFRHQPPVHWHVANRP